VTFPPEPWHLEGQLHLSVWLLPRAHLPRGLPSGTRPLSIAGRCAVGCAFVVYEQGSVLRYNELLSAVLVRKGLRPMVCITDIWVDSSASRDGGRALWGIPKELADFSVTRGVAFAARARQDGQQLAEAEFQRRRQLPGAWPMAYSVAQSLAGRLKVSPVRASTRLELTRAHWRFPDGSPLRRLRNRRPVISLTLRDFRIRFGAVGSAARSSFA
jgi:hypothetical protein